MATKDSACITEKKDVVIITEHGSYNISDMQRIGMPITPSEEELIEKVAEGLIQLPPCVEEKEESSD